MNNTIGLKTIKALLLLGVTGFFITGCARNAIPETGTGGEEILAEGKGETDKESAGELVPETKGEEELTVYYGTDSLDGLNKQVVYVVDITPESILDELKKVNVVSQDTKVMNFSDEGDLIKLDLSSEFETYVNMMGTNGEYVVMGGLTDTFLTAYDAKEIMITVAGNELSTGHTEYDEPLGFFKEVADEDGLSEEASGEYDIERYHLIEVTCDDGKLSGYLPGFAGMSDEKLEDEWNKAIETYAKGDMLPGGITEDKAKELSDRLDKASSVDVDYTITATDSEYVSFTFTRQCTMGDDPLSNIEVDSFILHFDLKTGKYWSEKADNEGVVPL